MHYCTIYVCMYIYTHTYIHTYIYITNCRQYCFGLLGLISADGGKAIYPPQVISHMWDHLSHARVLKLEKLVSMHNAIYYTYYTYIHIYIYICIYVYMYICIYV